MMEQALYELLSIEKTIYLKLLETIELTKDLAESVERQDHVLIRLFLSMRQKALFELQELNSSIELLRLELSPPAENRLMALCSGDEAQSPQEIPVVECIASNQRLLKKLAELDKDANQRLCGEHSFYLK